MTADDDKDRTSTAPARDDATPAQDGGVPEQEPAEGGDDVSPPTEGSPKG